MAQPNPFDPFAQAPVAPSQGMMNNGQPPGTPQSMQGGGSQFGSPPAQQQQQHGQQQQQQQNFQQPPQQNFQQPPQQQQLMQQQQHQQPPFQQGPPSTPQQNALVPAQQQSNPYGGMVSPQQPAGDPFGNQQQQQALVPTVQEGNQWAAQAPAQAPAANMFDPFAAAPAPPPAAAPPVPSEDPFPMFSAETQQQPPPQQYQQHQQQALVPATVPGPSPYAVAPESNHQFSQADDQSWLPSDQDTNRNGDQGEMVPYGQNEVVPYVEPTPQLHHINKYSNTLAGQAPPNSAPLPTGEKVLKSGYVLSRISFRTILLKKWKQSYWVQYGPHTMLWFRTYADFDDWLNNPYHTQQQRNFLIKLAVNFVHDLYKPNVRGYQVTQARSKQYRNKILRQFKLERWMDYGPTIAAAFASSDPKEVDELRQAIVECMRNTPVGEGIRATGAVRQENSGLDGSHRSVQSYREQGGYHNAGGVSHASAGDLREDHRGFDDSASAPVRSTYAPPGRHDSFQSAPPAQQQFQGQYQQQSY